MFTSSRIGLCWPLVAIALGCSSTAATGGNGGTTDASSDSDTGIGGTDTAGGDTLVTDAFCQDTTGCFENDDAQDGSSGTDANSDSGSTTCPPVLKDKTAGAHGKSCTQDSDCMYGLCQKGGFLTGYNDKLGYCTKDCACSDPAAQCSNDNIKGGSVLTVEFICGFELSQSGGNPKAGTSPQKRCSMHCKADAECATWNPALPHCIGSTQYVSSAGVCGFDPFK